MTPDDTSVTSAEESPAPAAPRAGETLRRAREERGVSLEQAAQATRISKRYLQALEEDSPLDDLLNPAYSRLFLRNYAKYLRLDPEKVAPAPVEQPAVEPPIVDVLRPAMRPPGRVLSRLLIAAAVLAFIGLLITRNYGQRPSAETTPPPAAIPTQSAPPTAPSSPTPSPSPTPVTGLSAVLKVTNRSWISATADGKNVLREILDPPRSVTLEADRVLELILGNAGGVRLRLNGDPVSTGGPGEVVHLAFEFREGQVVRTTVETSPSPTPGDR